jgi:ribosomal peptide maturation radical SAM protein 1
VTRRPHVVLVSMPWASASRPSLANGLLTAMARRAGFSCESRSLHVDFSTRIGADLFEAMAVEMGSVGEHLFAVDLFGRTKLRSNAFLERSAGRTNGGISRIDVPYDALVTFRDAVVPEFLDECVADVLDRDPEVVGFTCLFNQVLPSLALASRLKRARPGILTLLGGGSVHGVMGEEYARAFPRIIDHVFTGEADATWIPFLESLAASSPRPALPGIAVNGKLDLPPAPFFDLDSNPTPDYDEYFATRAALEAAGERPTPHRDLPYESARGCWWGEKSHCTFCGLNNEGMASRSKSTERVLTEITELSSRYQVRELFAADNILTHTGYRDLLPRVADLGLDLRLFYEIKSNVTRDDVAVLARAGVRWIQPGVESLNDHVLALIRKGVSAAQNIQLLKWLHEFGITPFYNILVGFPGETSDDYEQLLALLPALFHLAAPMTGRAQLAEVHRFSPFHDEAASLGIRNVRPQWYYRHLIPPAAANVERFAYFFERDIPGDAPILAYRERLDGVLSRWTRSRRRLIASLGTGFIEIHQTAPREETLATLTGIHALVFLLADAQTSRAKISRQLTEMLPAVSADSDAVVSELIRLGILVDVGKRVVGVVPFETPRSSSDLRAWTDMWVMQREGVRA